MSEETCPLCGEALVYDGMDVVEDDDGMAYVANVLVCPVCDYECVEAPTDD